MTGFVRTVLLRRAGSTIQAGLLTALSMLNETDQQTEPDEIDDEREEPVQPVATSRLSLLPER